MKSCPAFVPSCCMNADARRSKWDAWDTVLNPTRDAWAGAYAHAHTHICGRVFRRSVPSVPFSARCIVVHETRAEADRDNSFRRQVCRSLRDERARGKRQIVVPVRLSRCRSVLLACLRVDTSGGAKRYVQPFRKTDLRLAAPARPVPGKARGTLLLRMRDGELVPDALLDLGGKPQPLFVAQRVAEIKRLPSRKAAPTLNPML